MKSIADTLAKKITDLETSQVRLELECLRSVLPKGVRQLVTDAAIKDGKIQAKATPAVISYINQYNKELVEQVKDCVTKKIR